ncbi:hypothetical protein BH10PSE19_BH10PSE19_02460 [soil metagenome]
MTIKTVAATMFLLGITTIAFAGPTASLTNPIFQVKKGDSLKVDEAYSTVAVKKDYPTSATTRKGVKNVRNHTGVHSS